MSSTRFESVGTGEFLATLRGDLEAATRSLRIVCPWIDEYFAEEVCGASKPTLAVHVLMRPEARVDAEMWPHMVEAMACFGTRFHTLDIRTLDRLHAKAFVIDDEIAYVGSTNFYRYSLSHSRELALRGPLAQMGQLAAELRALYDDGAPYVVAEPAKKPSTPKKRPSAEAAGMEKEVDDPIVREILRKNPKAWVVGRRPKQSDQ